MNVVADQCCYGLKAKGTNGEGPARKTIGFMMNSPCIALQLQRRCPNRIGCKMHNHVQLEGGKTKKAQVYPPELCKAVCGGLVKQIEADKKGANTL